VVARNSCDPRFRLREIFEIWAIRHIPGALFHEKENLDARRKSKPNSSVHNLLPALETQEQPARRFFDDPYAFDLLSGSYRMFARLARIPLLGKLVYAILDLGWPYSRSSAVVRTRAIDDLVRDAIGSGVCQLVLLGAGLDSRGCRLHEAEGIEVFEVDHPATQRMKKERLHACTGKLPTNIRYVAIDLERDALEAKLVESGYHPDVQAVVVWEGVIDYLTESAVLSTLAGRSAAEVTQRGGRFAQLAPGLEAAAKTGAAA
jgi:methyltransferase (TIGR00027 family)